MSEVVVTGADKDRFSDPQARTSKNRREPPVFLSEGLERLLFNQLERTA